MNDDVKLKHIKDYYLNQRVCLADGGLQSSVHLLLWLQRVPLGHRTPGIGQHVWPVTQPDAWGAVADPALADGVVAAQLVVVVHSDQHLDFLFIDTAEEEKLLNLKDTTEMHYGRCRIQLFLALDPY